MFLQMYRNLII